MKTVSQLVLDTLTEHGLCRHEADIVLDLMKADPANADMKGRWGDRTEGYAPQLLALVKYAAKATAKAYLEQTKPQHFAIALLA